MEPEFTEPCMLGPCVSVVPSTGSAVTECGVQQVPTAAYPLVLALHMGFAHFCFTYISYCSFFRVYL